MNASSGEAQASPSKRTHSRPVVLNFTPLANAGRAAFFGSLRGAQTAKIANIVICVLGMRSSGVRRARKSLSHLPMNLHCRVISRWTGWPCHQMQTQVWDPDRLRLQSFQPRTRTPNWRLHRCPPWALSFTTALDNVGLVAGSTNLGAARMVGNAFTATPVLPTR